MNITSAKVIVCSPGRNFVTLKIETDAGIYGLGDATVNGRELVVAQYLEEYVIPSLIGRDAGQIEDIWQFFYRGYYWKKGVIDMAAIAAVDMALWDIKAKAAGMPLYQLLGGKSREYINVYTHVNGETIADVLADFEVALSKGYKFIRVQCGVPGLAKTYGVTKKGVAYEPANANLPEEQVWNTTKYLNSVETVFKAVREKFGYGVELLTDVHHRLTPIEAARLGKMLEPYRLFWMEDPTPTDNQESFKLIRQHTTTKIAVGEVTSSIYDIKDLITNQLVDYIRTTIVHGGGITHIRQIANLAALYQIKTGFHGATDLSPITMGCALHVGTAINNFGIQEHMPHCQVTESVFTHAYQFDHGTFLVGEAPGHGVDINEELAAQYPYKRASLPVNRLEDGTLHPW
ncbi:D-mannonate dehydratase ManD [Vibrio gazogenes]|uniref:Mannonate dehydratase n=1 Tax=Vibrio gazogenes DSM 21264 = NBRC 103151 TaxID=1123492 RepID=A0A1M5GZW0_VIBGA|nr:D-mannonate dehydratase ManD [Vibrio gazogenes]USP15774.1 D-galactonate dehydratase family protein [Vibrio gazogenes]SHG08972.1 mannonate dehydratase [Vibrio gazogenes DSM 21264] [Vibrio gazogenes DSM 21264 = NBRC 103151]SJN52756.1 Starvation-sensing protein RspA [Vibrio gazogenes]